MLTATIAVDPRYTIGSIDRRLFGGFVEHLGRHIYTGIYEPGHPTAGADGFRRDVVDLVRDLGVTTIRYPGGNFVSGFKWEDSVGPVDTRPRRLDLAWHSTEPNEVGLHEFAQWLRLVNSELMLAVNLGTRGTSEAIELLEYTNISSGTDRSDERIRNGLIDPLNVRMWCLGNEMDGPWQLGHSTAEDYGSLASRTAKAMRQIDPSLELVVCGSSSSAMPTFGEWERVTLQHTYDDVDMISCHAYYSEKNGDLATFLASGVNMDRFIESVVATADHVKAVKKSDKQINLSFDEWNVWDIDRYEGTDKIVDPDHWPIAPRLLEDIYTVADAVVVGGLLISLLKHADRVVSASIAQLVNVIAPIMTEPGGAAWRQTIYFPFSITSRLAKGQVIDSRIESETYSTADYGDVPYVDAVVTRDGDSLAVFAINRSTIEPLEVGVALASSGTYEIQEAVGIWDDDFYAVNSAAAPERVTAKEMRNIEIADGVMTVTLPPVSWVAVSLASRDHD